MEYYQEPSALNKNLEIYILEFKESYRTAQRVHSDSIRKGRCPT